MESVLGNSRKADITFSSSGVIDISSNVAKSLNLGKGDVIDVMSHQGEFFLYVKHKAPVIGKHEAMVFPSCKKGLHFRASSIRLCHFVLNECSQNGKSRLCVGEPVIHPTIGTIIPIITKMRIHD